MNLIKKIVSCSLALTVAFGGICAKAETRDSSSVKNKIFGVASTVGGVGLATALGFGIWHWHKNHKPSDNPTDRFSATFDDGFNILIIGENPENRQKIIDELKQGKYTYVSWSDESNTSLRGIVDFCMTTDGRTLNAKNHREIYSKANGSNKPHHILGCDTSDENAPNLIKNAHLVIAVLDNTQESDNKIGQLLSDNDAAQHSRILTLIDYNRPVPNTTLQGTNGGDPTVKDCINFFKSRSKCITNTSFLQFNHMDVLLSDFAYYWEISSQGVNNHLFYEYVSPLNRNIPSANTVDDDIRWIKNYQEHPEWVVKI